MTTLGTRSSRTTILVQVLGTVCPSRTVRYLPNLRAVPDSAWCGSLMWPAANPSRAEDRAEARPEARASDRLPRARRECGRLARPWRLSIHTTPPQSSPFGSSEQRPSTDRWGRREFDRVAYCRARRNGHATVPTGTGTGTGTGTNGGRDVGSITALPKDATGRTGLTTNGHQHHDPSVTVAVSTAAGIAQPAASTGVRSSRPVATVVIVSKLTRIADVI